MSASLFASTVTPGRTAPDASFTTPAIVLCAPAIAGSAATQTNVRANDTAILLNMPPLLIDPPTGLCRREATAGSVKNPWKIAIADILVRSISNVWIRRLFETPALYPFFGCANRSAFRHSDQERGSRKG